MKKLKFGEVNFSEKKELLTIALSVSDGDYCVISAAKEKETNVYCLVLEYVDELIYDDEVEYSIRKTIMLDYFELEKLLSYEIQPALDDL